MPQGVSKTVVCRSNKTWLYKGDPECIGIRDTDAFRYSTVFKPNKCHDFSVILIIEIAVSLNNKVGEKGVYFYCKQFMS